MKRIKYVQEKALLHEPHALASFDEFSHSVFGDMIVGQDVYIRC